MRDRDIVAFIVDHFERGFVNDPDDRGGATNFGVTQATLGVAWHLGRAATVDEVRRLTRETAIDVLVLQFVLVPRFDRIMSWRLRFALIDYGINSGPVNGARALQRILGLRPDGVIGPITIAKVNGLTPDLLRLAAAKHIGDRLRLVGRLVTRRPELKQYRFGEGWCNRVATLLETIAV
jgi:lysozyme family protein